MSIEAFAGKAWLGVTLMKKIQFGDKVGHSRVAIDKVFKGTPAYKAGFESEDVILEIDKTKITEIEQMIQEVSGKKLGTTVSFKIERDNKVLIKELILQEKPDMKKMAEGNLLNHKAPDFEADLYKEGSWSNFKLSNQQGRVTILKFWSTTCVACIMAERELSKFTLSNSHVDIVAVTVEDKDMVQKFLKKRNKIYLSEGEKLGKIKTVVADPLKIGEEYIVSAVPMFVVLDKKGIVQMVSVGAGPNLKKVLSKAVKLHAGPGLIEEFKKKFLK